MVIRETILAFFLLLLLPLQTCNGGRGGKHCSPSLCGKISNISYPFRLETDPSNCGESKYSLSCENNVTILHLNGGRFFVQAINYHNYTIRLVDAGLPKQDYFSIPTTLLPDEGSWIYFYKYPYSNFKHKQQIERSPSLSMPIIFIRCQNPAVSSPFVSDITAPFCINRNGVNDTSPATALNSHFSCLITSMLLSVSSLKDSCSVDKKSLIPAAAAKVFYLSVTNIHREMAFGFELSWFNYCEKCLSGSCYIDNVNRIRCTGVRTGVSAGALMLLGIRIYVAMYLAAKCFCGTPFVTAFLIYKWRRRHLSAYNSIEEFLQNNNNLMPIRYAYSDIKKMTKGFKEKLGEGGFGSVYKGKLRSGQFAAVKMLLSKSKANGQDFINEVATIGRIHHANVVKLIGFCVEGSKRALVYDFMPNGSLDKYLFSRQGYVPLSWEKLYQISCGVARGIEYLHRGCEMQILHFDIKPHNILLDANFTPKISDFGLAKLYPTKGTIASLTAARGTIGYMAPELFYKNIGRVSYKADVYSFGMLLLEMTGRRKNLNPMAENLSENYYPFWVYDRLSNEELEIEDVTEEEDKLARKMIITGLWCIQMKPSDRPSMNKVLEMLEGDLLTLQLPPRPVLYPAESLVKDVEESSSLLDDSEKSCSY